MSDYQAVQKGSLKFKGVSDHSIKKSKKKKKKKDKEKEEALLEEAKSLAPSTSSTRIDRRTKAEIAYAKQKEKREAAEILEKASKSHKERILEFNKNLDEMSEHFDIPKVSWTK